MDWKCWDPPKKDTPHPREKEKPQLDCRTGEITFIIKPQTHQRCTDNSKKNTCVCQDPETPKRLSQNFVRMSSVEMARWHHGLDGHESE